MSCSARPIQLRAVSERAGSPNTSISPAVTRMRLQTALISVVLPAPFGPSRPKNEPAGMSRAKSSIASVPSSYRLVRPRSWSAGASSRNTASKLAIRAHRAEPPGGALAAESPPVVALVVGAIVAGADRPPPVLVLAVPVDGALQAVGEAHLRLPAQLPAQLLRGQGVAAVVTRAIGHMVHQRLVTPGQLEDPPHYLHVLQLVGPAGVVGLTRAAGLEHGVDGAAEILDEQPVAHLAAVAVHGERVAVEGVQHHQRNQLLGMLPRAVVVRAAADQRLDAVGVSVGRDQQVARRLGGRVGRGGVERRLLRE